MFEVLELVWPGGWSWGLPDQEWCWTGPSLGGIRIFCVVFDIVFQCCVFNVVVYLCFIFSTPFTFTPAQEC